MPTSQLITASDDLFWVQRSPAIFPMSAICSSSLSAPSPAAIAFAAFQQSSRSEAWRDSGLPYQKEEGRGDGVGVEVSVQHGSSLEQPICQRRGSPEGLRRCGRGALVSAQPMLESSSWCTIFLYVRVWRRGRRWIRRLRGERFVPAQRFFAEAGAGGRRWRGRARPIRRGAQSSPGFARSSRMRAAHACRVETWTGATRSIRQ